MDSNQVEAKLLVNNDRNQVVFAESNKDLVDLLFSFLTLPVGRIVSLLGKGHLGGCIDNIYESVENLQECHFQSKACREMLLHARSASEVQCMSLAIQIGQPEIHYKYFLCATCRCPFPCISLVGNTQCSRCGKVMDKEVTPSAGAPKREGLFVMETGTYVISDNLQISPVWVTTCFSFPVIREAKNITISLEEIKVLDLLKYALVSKDPLSKVFLTGGGSSGEDVRSKIKCESNSKESGETKANQNIITIKLVRKLNGKVLFAVVKEDFVELLFGFLTLPLGFIVKILGGQSSIGCLDNLYKSAQGFSNGDYVGFKGPYADTLLSPKIPKHFGSSCNLLGVEESIVNYVDLPGFGNFEYANPRYCSSISRSCSANIRGPTLFMATDELVVTQLSVISTFFLSKELNSGHDDVVEQIISIDKEEALKLLKASLSSKTVFTDAFPITK